MTHASGVAAAALLLSLGTATASADDIHVFTSGAPSAVERAIGAKFTRATGHHVDITAETLRKVRESLDKADHPDVVVLPMRIMNGLERAGAFRAGTKVDLARVGIGMVVREGAPKPDISTPDALRQALLKAHSIAHPDPKGGGFAGAQIDRMFDKLGIADQVRPKVVLMYAFTGGVATIAKGGAEIGLFNISEILPVKGVTLVGPLPAELQSYIVFSGAIHVRSSAPEAATAYLRALSAPDARAAWSAGGFELIGSRS